MATIDRAILDKAVARGVLSQTQCDELVALSQASETSSDASEKPNRALFTNSLDDEMRLVGGGNDIFVTVGIGLLFSGAFFAIRALYPENQIIEMAFLLGMNWIVAEIVTRQKRMRLSSTLLALIYSGAVLFLLIKHIINAYPLPSQFDLFAFFELRDNAWPIGLTLGGGMTIASILYFYRFKVPILAAVIAISITGLAFVGGAIYYYDQIISGSIALPRMEELTNAFADALVIPLIFGLIIFAVAVLLDLRDRERQTIWSDCAFWLHVVSAPFLVHPLFILATGQKVLSGQIKPELGASFMLGGMIVSFMLIALAIDRRSLLAPTLGYFGSVGVYYLVKGTANTTGIPPIAFILITVGSAVILFGAGWQKIRSLIIRPLLPTSILERLPPIKA